MLKHYVRKTFYPEAHEGMVEILEVMVETWAPELQARLAAEAVHAERRAAEVGKIETACEVLGIALTEDHRQQLASLELSGLQERLAALETGRTWPQG